MKIVRLFKKGETPKASIRTYFLRQYLIVTIKKQ